MFKMILFVVIFSVGIVEAKKAADFIFLGWEKSYKLNNQTFESDAHNAYLDIYVNELAKQPYIDEAKHFPPGSEIYKPLYNDTERRVFARLVIMVKMKPGYDPKNGDWWYGVYDKSGGEMYYQGRLKSCIACHKDGKETDYTFSKSVNAEIQRLIFNPRRSKK